MSKSDAIRVLRDSTGGSLPAQGNVVRWAGDTFRFVPGVRILTEIPDNPENGDIWEDGGALKIFVNGTTYTIG